MKQLQQFSNELFSIAVQTSDGNLSFDVESVARSLGFTEIKKGKEYVRWRTINGYLKKYLSQDVAKNDFIPESMVYKLAFKAGNATAEKFQDWLAVDVLPQIRKTGSYKQRKQTKFAVPTTLADALRLAADEAEKNEKLQLENAEMKPKALFADAVRGSTNSCLVKDLSVLLKQNGINIGQNRLFKYLRENGYLGKGNGHYNKPTQRSLDQGLFEYREHFHTNGIGEVEIRFTPLVTGKGQTYFINKFLNEVTLTNAH